ncbi:MAG: FHA domain-containing protein [Gemmatimonadota bacterium]|nr:FHA domain-containing protein [Gemmatimonadota bacterium]
MNARLTVLSGEMQGVEITLSDGDITIGRSGQDDLILPEEVVSRLQASLHYEGGRYLLRDEGSTNGTFINDRRVVEQVLRDGDVIEFGLDGPAARFETVPSPAKAEAAADAPSPGASATPIGAPRLDEGEPPDAWIDRGVAYSSTGIFKVPEETEPDPSPERATAAPGRSGLRLWVAMLAIVLALAVTVIAVLVL